MDEPRLPANEYDFVGTCGPEGQRWFYAKDGKWVEYTELEKLQLRLDDIQKQIADWKRDADEYQRKLEALMHLTYRSGYDS